MGENVFQEVGHDVKVVAEDVAHDVVGVVEFPAKAARVFNEIKTDYPAVKASLEQLATDIEKVDADVVTAIDAGGLNVTVDIATWNDIVAAVKAGKEAGAEIKAAFEQINAAAA